MKLRMHVLAGLIAAAAIPTFAQAAPYAGLGDIQQRAQLGTATGTVSRESRAAPSDRRQSEHASRYVNLAELQQRGQTGRGNGSEGATADFFTEHQRAMNEGVSHIEASQVAARKLAKTNQN